MDRLLGPVRILTIQADIAFARKLVSHRDEWAMGASWRMQPGSES